MASIRKRGENSWQITVSNGYDSAGTKLTEQKTVKRPKGEFTDKQWEKELEKLALEFENTVQKGLVTNGNITLKNFVDRWMEDYGSRQLQPKTLASYKFELDTKIIPALGHLRLDRIKPMHILEFLNNLMEDGVRQDGKPGSYSNRTIKYQHQILSSLFQSAVYWQVITGNPCDRVKPPRKETVVDKVKYFDDSQTVMFLEAVKNEEIKYQLIANITIYCGLRKGELLGLSWDDINEKECTITINKANQYLKEKGMFTKQPKNSSSIRDISIPGNVIKLLKEYKLWQNGQKAKCGDLWDKSWDDSKWIFTQWNGLPMAYDTPFQWFKKFIRQHNKKVMEDEKIKTKDKEKFILPEIAFHGLRHTSATLMIAEKVDVRTVSARLGHAQTSTTMNIYSHSLKSSDKKASSALENLLEKKNTSDSKQA